jgi:hypothetical protein
MARVALLEAALSAPKTVAEPPIGPGHNRGPDLEFDAAVDETEIRRIVALLKEQRATEPVDRPKLSEIAKVIDPANNKWRERLDEFAKSTLKGAGEEVGKRLIQAPWWISHGLSHDLRVPGPIVPPAREGRRRRFAPRSGTKLPPTSATISGRSVQIRFLTQTGPPLPIAAAST